MHRLSRDHFIVNIAQPENTSSGLFVVNRNPRMQDVKPDAYVGVVERVGDGCSIINVGDKVVVERWEYGQFDIDEERLLAKEVDVLITGGEEPAPGTVVLQLPEEPKSDVVIPDTVRPKQELFYFGKVVSSGDPDIVSGEFLWVLKSNDYQYRLGKHMLVFRNTEDVAVMRGQTA